MANGSAVRIVSIYATPWRFHGRLAPDEGRPAELGGLEEHYELYKEQLPRLLPDRLLTTSLSRTLVGLAEPVDGVTVAEARAELFALPSNQVVLSVTLSLSTRLTTGEHLNQVLDQCTAGQVRIGDQLAADALGSLFPTGRTGPAYFLPDPASDASRPAQRLLPERHQLVFLSRPANDPAPPDPALIERVLYRDHPPYRPEFVEPRIPQQLNSIDANGNGDRRAAGLAAALTRRVRRPDGESEPAGEPHTRAVVTPYVSLLYGQREYVEASIFLSTVHAVGTAARFRAIWREAYQQVLHFREQKQKAVAGQQTRDDLELLADNLGNLEFDLTFSVEFPLMRIETFQSQLYEAMDLGNQADTLSRMFAQLGGSLRSEITAIEVRERRRQESRQVWNSVAAGLLSVIGVPVGFVLAYLGINAKEVPDDHKSMWDAHFALLYLFAGIFALIPVFLILFPYLREMALPRRDRRALVAGCAAGLFGLGLLGYGLLNGPLPGRNPEVFDAGLTALGGFFVVGGLTLIGLWAWRYLRRLLPGPASEQPAEAG